MENILKHERILVKEMDEELKLEGGFNLPGKSPTHIILYINDKGVEEFIKFTRMDNSVISKHDEEYVKDFLKRRGHEN